MKFELSTLLLGLVATAHGNGFAKTCKDIKISGSTLSAKCGDGKGGWPKSTLNLNHMFTSNDGAMTWKKNGGAMNLCWVWWGPLNDGDNGYVEFKCKRKNNNLLDWTNTFCLGLHISNHSGKMVYDGYQGKIAC